MKGGTLRECVLADYQERVATLEMPEELRRALKSHERAPQFLDNLVRELGVAQVAFQTRGLGGLKRTHIRDAVFSLTDIFIESVKAKAEQRLLSPLRVSMINDAYQQKRKLEHWAENAVKADPTLKSIDLSEGLEV